MIAQLFDLGFHFLQRRRQRHFVPLVPIKRFLPLIPLPAQLLDVVNHQRHFKSLELFAFFQKLFGERRLHAERLKLLFELVQNIVDAVQVVLRFR
ncbi:hypothetical protein LR69_02692 [Geobacillus sp. BCO2]|nr:hypothetical protein LR69_02692 [Geobacillus sp. BCO2]